MWVFEELADFVIRNTHNGGHFVASILMPTFCSFVLSEETDCCLLATPRLTSSQIPCRRTHYSLWIGSSFWCHLQTFSHAWQVSYIFISLHKGKIWPIIIMTGDEESWFALQWGSQHFNRKIKSPSQQITHLQWPLIMCDSVIDISPLMLILACGSLSSIHTIQFL